MLSYIPQWLKIKHFTMCLLLLFLSNYHLLYAATPKMDLHEKERVDKFLRHAMIRGYGFYTLLGTKPITVIAPIPILDEDEKRELIKGQSEEFQKHVSLKRYRPSKEEAKKLWYDWESIQNKYLSEQFFFRFDDDWNGIVFVNIPTVVHIMDQYSNDFSEVFGRDFDRKKAAQVIGNTDDPAWQKLKEKHYLLGLLFGYGEMNSKYFVREKNGKFYPLRKPSLELVGQIGRGAQTLEVKDLDIPRFISYHVHDPIEEHFKQEREKIIELYEGKNFLELTLSYLSGTPPKKERKKPSKEEEKLIRENIGYNTVMK